MAAASDVVAAPQSRGLTWRVSPHGRRSLPASARCAGSPRRALTLQHIGTYDADGVFDPSALRKRQIVSERAAPEL